VRSQPGPGQYANGIAAFATKDVARTDVRSPEGAILSYRSTYIRPAVRLDIRQDDHVAGATGGLQAIRHELRLASHMTVVGIDERGLDALIGDARDAVEIRAILLAGRVVERSERFGWAVSVPLIAPMRRLMARMTRDSIVGPITAP
jgi:hypothetical protein